MIRLGPFFRAGQADTPAPRFTLKISREFAQHILPTFVRYAPRKDFANTQILCYHFLNHSKPAGRTKA
jgi:hypothetical protein